MNDKEPDAPSNVRQFPTTRVAVKTTKVTRRAPRRRRPYHYVRRHTPHYFIVLSGISCAIIVCALNAWAFITRSLLLSDVAFAAVSVTAVVISVAFFWGIYMVMSGNIPAHRIKVFVPHGIVGVLSPIFYTLNISFDLNDLGIRPTSGLSLGCSLVCLALLGVQFAMGKAVVHSDPLQVIKAAS
jgi:hypothetical protein